MTKTPILLTGGNGLVGSKFVQLFSNTYEFQNLDRRDSQNPVDILNDNAVEAAVNSSSAKFLIHMAAFTNVSTAYEQKDDKTSPSYQINVVGTQNVIRACQKTKKHLIHISTAYVFDGKKQALYTEEDAPNPIEWYGQTKYEAEQAVMDSQIDWTILRIDTPFRSDNFAKLDQARKILETAKKGIPLFTDHYFGPTYIDDFAKILDWVIRSKTTGIYHASSGEKWSDYDFAEAINQAHKLNLDIKPGSLAEYLQTTQRPYQQNTAMSNKKLKNQIDFELKSVKEAITEVHL